ncbi:MAG: LytTR family transcriptional regulator [Oscillospiraceae bacterium]|nr:LytTR family transcriptional regulator [Oscillospiraceae bacterium]
MKDMIMYAEVFDHTLFMHTQKRTFKIKKSLHKFCEENKDFYRIHKSFCVNINAVKSVSQKGVLLLNGTTLPVRKGEVKALKFVLKNKIFSLLFKENVVK